MSACKFCGTLIPLDKKFCPKCGWKTEDEPKKPKSRFDARIHPPGYVCKRCGETSPNLVAHWNHTCSAQNKKTSSQPGNP